VLDLSIALNRKTSARASPRHRPGGRPRRPSGRLFVRLLDAHVPVPGNSAPSWRSLWPNPHSSGRCRHRSGHPREESPPQRDEHGSKNFRPIETMSGAPTILKVAMPIVEIRADSQHEHGVRAAGAPRVTDWRPTPHDETLPACLSEISRSLRGPAAHWRHVHDYSGLGLRQTCSSALGVRTSRPIIVLIINRLATRRRDPQELRSGDAP
jgi:hypothetical protein